MLCRPGKILSPQFFLIKSKLLTRYQAIISNDLQMSSLISYFKALTSAPNGTGAGFLPGCSKIQKCTSGQTIAAIKVCKFASVKLFSSNQAAVSSYFSKLLPLLAPLQHSNGGPIIAFQGEQII